MSIENIGRTRENPSWVETARELMVQIDTSNKNRNGLEKIFS